MIITRVRGALLWAGAALGLLSVAVALAVAFLGFSFLVFRSGSMSPQIPTGALALARTVPAADVVEGDVVSVISTGGQRITHRVVGTTLRGEEASLILQGDANGTPDQEIYQVRSVERVSLSVPYAGYVLVHALTPPGLLAVGCLSLMLLLMGPTRREDTVSVELLPVQTPRGDPAPGRHRSRRRQVAAGLAGVGIVAAAARRRRRSRIVIGVTLLIAALLPAQVHRALGVSDTMAFFTDRNTAATGTFGANAFFRCDTAALNAAGTTRPYLYYMLDENPPTNVATDLTALDSSTNGRTGQYRGAATAALPGKTSDPTRACSNRDDGRSIAFDGVRGYLTSPNVGTISGGALNTFTLSLWFKTTSTSGGKLIGLGNSATAASSSYDRHLYMGNNGTMWFGVFPTAVRTISSPASRPLNDGAWHHVAATLSSAGMALYIDGALVANRNDTTTAQQTGYTAQTPAVWKIANDNLNGWINGANVPNVASTFFGGSLDEVAVYDTQALSATTIEQMYRAGK